MRKPFYNTGLCLTLLVALSIGLAITANHFHPGSVFAHGTPTVEVIPLS